MWTRILKRMKGSFTKKKMKQEKEGIVYMPYEWFGIDDGPLRQFDDVLPTCAICHHPIVLTWDLPKEKATQILETLHDLLRQKGLEPPEYHEDFFELPGETDDGQWAHEYCLTR